MMNLLVILIAALIFVILVVIIFRTIKDAFKFNTVGSMILSVCISALATIGLYRNINGIMGIILLPYAALGIAIFLMLTALFFRKKRLSIRRCGKRKTSELGKKTPETHQKQLRR